MTDLDLSSSEAASSNFAACEPATMEVEPASSTFAPCEPANIEVDANMMAETIETAQSPTESVLLNPGLSDMPIATSPSPTNALGDDQTFGDVKEESGMYCQDAAPKWPFKRPPSSDVESDEESEGDSSNASSASTPSRSLSAMGGHSESGQLILDVDRVNVTFSTS
jgi:hypothetical protein